jgi:hypothetical protein
MALLKVGQAMVTAAYYTSKEQLYKVLAGGRNKDQTAFTMMSLEQTNEYPN